MQRLPASGGRSQDCLADLLLGLKRCSQSRHGLAPQLVAFSCLSQLLAILCDRQDPEGTPAAYRTLVYALVEAENPDARDFALRNLMGVLQRQEGVPVGILIELMMKKFQVTPSEPLSVIEIELFLVISKHPRCTTRYAETLLALLARCTVEDQNIGRAASAPLLTLLRRYSREDSVQVFFERFVQATLSRLIQRASPRHQVVQGMEILAKVASLRSAPLDGRLRSLLGEVCRAYLSSFQSLHPNLQALLDLWPAEKQGLELWVKRQFPEPRPPSSQGSCPPPDMGGRLEVRSITPSHQGESPRGKQKPPEVAYAAPFQPPFHPGRGPMELPEYRGLHDGHQQGPLPGHHPQHQVPHLPLSPREQPGHQPPLAAAHSSPPRKPVVQEPITEPPSPADHAGIPGQVDGEWSHQGSPNGRQVGQVVQLAKETEGLRAELERAKERQLQALKEAEELRAELSQAKELQKRVEAEVVQLQRRRDELISQRPGPASSEPVGNRTREAATSRAPGAVNGSEPPTPIAGAIPKLKARPQAPPRGRTPVEEPRPEDVEKAKSLLRAFQEPLLVLYSQYAKPKRMVTGRRLELQLDHFENMLTDMELLPARVNKRSLQNIMKTTPKSEGILLFEEFQALLFQLSQRHFVEAEAAPFQVAIEELVLTVPLDGGPAQLKAQALLQHLSRVTEQSKLSNMRVARPAFRLALQEIAKNWLLDAAQAFNAQLDAKEELDPSEIPKGLELRDETAKNSSADEADEVSFPRVVMTAEVAAVLMRSPSPAGEADRNKQLKKPAAKAADKRQAVASPAPSPPTGSPPRPRPAGPAAAVAVQKKAEAQKADLQTLQVPGPKQPSRRPSRADSVASGKDGDKATAGGRTKKELDAAVNEMLTQEAFKKYTASLDSGLKKILELFSKLKGNGQMTQAAFVAMGEAFGLGEKEVIQSVYKSVGGSSLNQELVPKTLLVLASKAMQVQGRGDAANQKQLQKAFGALARHMLLYQKDQDPGPLQKFLAEYKANQDMKLQPFEAPWDEAAADEGQATLKLPLETQQVVKGPGDKPRLSGKKSNEKDQTGKASPQGSTPLPVKEREREQLKDKQQESTARAAVPVQERESEHAKEKEQKVEAKPVVPVKEEESKQSKEKEEIPPLSPVKEKESEQPKGKTDVPPPPLVPVKEGQSEEQKGREEIPSPPVPVQAGEEAGAKAKEEPAGPPAKEPQKPEGAGGEKTPRVAEETVLQLEPSPQREKEQKGPDASNSEAVVPVGEEKKEPALAQAEQKERGEGKEKEGEVGEEGATAPKEAAKTGEKGAEAPKDGAIEDKGKGEVPGPGAEAPTDKPLEKPEVGGPEAAKEKSFETAEKKEEIGKETKAEVPQEEKPSETAEKNEEKGKEAKTEEVQKENSSETAEKKEEEKDAKTGGASQEAQKDKPSETAGKNEEEEGKESKTDGSSQEVPMEKPSETSEKKEEKGKEAKAEGATQEAPKDTPSETAEKEEDKAKAAGGPAETPQQPDSPKEGKDKDPEGKPKEEKKEAEKG